MQLKPVALVLSSHLNTRNDNLVTNLIEIFFSYLRPMLSLHMIL